MRKGHLPLAAAVIGTIGAVSASAAEPTYEELKQQLSELQQRINAIESRQHEQITAAQVDATVQQVLEDAHRRSQLLAAEDEITAGYDRGFFIRSADGSFLLKPALQVQFRNITNVTTDDDTDVENGFEVRRLRFRFDGNALSKDLTYSFVWDTSRNGGAVSLLDAWVQYRFAPEWAVRLGQFKESVFHERDVGGFSQLAVDRSFVDTYLAGNETDRVQGLSLIYGGTKENPIRAEVAFHDGANTKNTNFQDSDNAHFGFGGRVDYKLAGDWSAYRDFTAKNNKADLLVVGAGADWTQGDTDVIRSAVDVQWETTTGLGIFAALNVRHTGSDDGDDDATDWGGLVQAGYLIDARWEPFARWAFVRFDDSNGDDTFNEFTVGVNYYLGPDGSYLHRAKFTVDVVYLPDGLPNNQTGLGYLASDDDQFVLRGQFQLTL